MNYHYVGYENSWQDMQEMLRNGQIDMVTSARRTREREKEFAFSKPIGTSYAEMSVRVDDDRYQYNDSVIAISQGFLTDRDLNFHVERNLSWNFRSNGHRKKQSKNRIT